MEPEQAAKFTNLTLAIRVATGLKAGRRPVVAAYLGEQAAMFGAGDLLVAPVQHLGGVEIADRDFPAEAAARFGISGMTGKHGALAARPEEGSVAMRPGLADLARDALFLVILQREADGEEALGPGIALRQQIQIAVIFGGDGMDFRAALAFGGEPVEPGQVCHGQAVVIAVPLRDQSPLR